jgi:hypothetical protein
MLQNYQTSLHFLKLVCRIHLSLEDNDTTQTLPVLLYIAFTCTTENYSSVSMYRSKKKIIFLLTYGAEPFLRSCQLCSQSGTSQHFKEPEGSSPCTQKPSTGPYPEPDRSSSYHPILSKDNILAK